MAKSRSVVEWSDFRMVLNKMAAILSNTIRKPDQNVRFLNCKAKWQPFCPKPFENRTKKSGFRMAFGKPTFKKSGFWMIPDFIWSVFGSPLYVTNTVTIWLPDTQLTETSGIHIPTLRPFSEKTLCHPNIALSLGWFINYVTWTQAQGREGEALVLQLNKNQ